MKNKDILRHVRRILNLYLLMDTHDFQSFMQLFDRMETNSSLKGAGRQLACIAKLIFYCGIKEGEIPELTIRDVIDKDGKIIRIIRKFSKPIMLTDEIERCIAKHIEEMNIRNPSLVKRRSPLFPSYPNTRKIKRHLKSFGTTSHSNPSCGHPLLLPEGIGGRQVKGMDIRERQQTEADIDKAVSSGCAKFENPGRCVY